MSEWLEIAVMAEDSLVDAITELFEDMRSGGVVIEDPAVISQYAAQTHPDEWGVPESAEQLPLIKAYWPVDEQLEQRVNQIYQSLAGLGVEIASRVKTQKVRDEDWATAWQAYYKPLRAGERLVIKPSWEEWPARDNDLIVEMDPGLAFGCGTHATTVLCLELLEKHLASGAVVFDVGTGTGILAITAAKLGAAAVLATDIDMLACRVALENVRRNRVEDLVRVTQGDLLERMGGRQANLIVANIIADVIIKLTPEVSRLLAPGGLFIASGIIKERLENVRETLEENGFDVREQCSRDNWAALVGEKRLL